MDLEKKLLDWEDGYHPIYPETNKEKKEREDRNFYTLTVYFGGYYQPMNTTLMEHTIFIQASFRWITRHKSKFIYIFYCFLFI